MSDTLFPQTPSPLVAIFLRRDLLHLNIQIMGNLLYVIAVILVIAWVIGFVGYSAGGLIHVLLVIAVIAVVLRLIRGDRVV